MISLWQAYLAYVVVFTSILLICFLFPTQDDPRIVRDLPSCDAGLLGFCTSAY